MLCFVSIADCMHGAQGGNVQSDFTETGCRNWKNALGETGKLASHTRCSSHLFAAERFAFVQRAAAGVDEQLSEANAQQRSREQVERQQNRKIAEIIFDCMRFLARQGLAFRGHSENDASDNKGNFLELVSFLTRYSPELHRWMMHHPGNVSWLSPSLQNEMIDIVGHEILKTVSEQAKDKPFAILCDEVLRVDFFVPLLDAVLSSITTRFSKRATDFMTRITAFSPENWVSETDEKSKHFTEAVRCLAAYYNLDASLAVVQYSLFISPKDNDGKDDVSERTERSKCKTLASLLEYMHTKKLSAVYTEFYKLLEICATIPVTSACNERSHSKLKLIKTETRSTSGDERTEALLVIAVEKQICNDLSLSSLVDTFALKPRKLKL